MATDTETVEALGKVDLFAGLSPRALKKVAAATKTATHPTGKLLTKEGDGGVAFHLLRSGSAEVVVGGTVVRTLGPGDYFGDLALIDGKPRSATVRTTAQTATTTLVAWEFTPLLDSEPEIAKALLLVMCARLRSAEKR